MLSILIGIYWSARSLPMKYNENWAHTNRVQLFKEWVSISIRIICVLGNVIEQDWIHRLHWSTPCNVMFWWKLDNTVLTKKSWQEQSIIQRKDAIERSDQRARNLLLETLTLNSTLSDRVLVVKIVSARVLVVKSLLRTLFPQEWKNRNRHPVLE